MTKVVDLAKVYCVAAHSAVGQLRKYVLTDYHLHPIEVLDILELAADVDDDMRCAALLHDVKEDTRTKERHLGMFFNETVLKYVDDLTDVSVPADGTRVVRKEIDRLHLAQASPKAMSIKLADLISNGKSIAQSDKKFAVTFMKEFKLLLGVLRKGDPTLHAMATKIVNDYYEEIENAKQVVRPV